eukprot:6398115-Pyramimonas_sp.AAC.1
MGSPTAGPTGRVPVSARPMSAHSSRVFWPQGELHRRPQWQGPRSSAPPMSAGLTRSVAP